MERLCFQMELVPGQEAEYERRHDEIWPDMVAALVASGFENYSLFRRGTSVIGYAECHPDARTALDKMGETDVNARWQEWFSDVIASITTPDGELFTFDQVWHLEDHTS